MKDLTLTETDLKSSVKVVVDLVIKANVCQQCIKDAYQLARGLLYRVVEDLSAVYLIDKFNYRIIQLDSWYYLLTINDWVDEISELIEYKLTYKDLHQLVIWSVSAALGVFEHRLKRIADNADLGVYGEISQDMLEKTFSNYKGDK